MTQSKPGVSLEQLMAEYGTVLLRTCCLYLRDYHLAEDAVQETFIKAARGLSRFHGESSLQTWLIRIAINTCRDIQRSAWHRFVDRRIQADTLSPLSAPAQPDDAVLPAVAALSTKYKDVIILRFYHNLTLSDIAAVLSVPTQTAASRLRRAKAKLRRALEKEYFDEG